MPSQFTVNNTSRIPRSYFRRKFGDVIETRIRNRATREGITIPSQLEEEVARAGRPWHFRLQRIFGGKTERSTSGTTLAGSEKMNGSGINYQLKPVSSARIQRLDNPLQRVDPSGWVMSEPSKHDPHVPSKNPVVSPQVEDDSDPTTAALNAGPGPSIVDRSDRMPRTFTVEFADQPHLRRRPRAASGASPMVRTNSGWEGQRLNLPGEPPQPPSRNCHLNMYSHFHRHIYVPYNHGAKHSLQAECPS